jgi:hypothetical protein
MFDEIQKEYEFTNEKSSKEALLKYLDKIEENGQYSHEAAEMLRVLGFEVEVYKTDYKCCCGRVKRAWNAVFAWQNTLWFEKFSSSYDNDIANEHVDYESNIILNELLKMR